MQDIITYFTKEDAEQIIKIYENDKRYNMKMLSPVSKDSENYRIQIYHKKYRRAILAISLDEFIDIMTMYNELDKPDTK